MWGRGGVGGAATLEVPMGKGPVCAIGYTPLEPKVREEDKRKQHCGTHNFEFASILSLVADRVESLKPKSPNYHYLIYLAIVDQVQVSERHFWMVSAYLACSPRLLR